MDIASHSGAVDWGLILSRVKSMISKFCGFERIIRIFSHLYFYVGSQRGVTWKDDNVLNSKVICVNFLIFSSFL